MPFTIPTVSDFKRQFARDFPFAVPAFGADGTIVLAAGVITSIGLKAPGQGYTSAPAVAVIDPTGGGAVVTATIANGAVTGFTVTAGGAGYTNPSLLITGGAGDNTDLTRVTDDDVTGALQDAYFNVNPGLFGDQTSWSRAFCYLAAHNLVQRLLVAGQGIRSRGTWLENAKGVGDLSSSFSIPPQILESPFLALVSKTGYGLRYLEIITPLLIGNMQTNFRRTPP